MKKFLAIVLAFCMLLTMVACGAAEEQTPPVEAPENEQSAQPTPGQEVEPTPEVEGSIGGIEVDENLLNVEITIPAEFFEGATEDDIEAEAQESGFQDCKINEDGSVTYTMTKAKHKEMLEELAAEMDALLAEASVGENKVESFVSIEHNDNFSVIDVFVDPALHSPMDTLYALVFFLAGAYYQAFEGVAEEDIDVEVSFIDCNDGETVLDASSYRTFITNLENQEQEEAATEEPAA